MTLQGTGEEWRAMNGPGGTYEPGKDDAVVAEAKARIEQIRKRDVELRLVDRQGKPLAETPVEVVQTRQAFPFGSNCWQLDTLYRLGQWEGDKARYWRHRFEEVFEAANAQCYWTERPRNDGPKCEDLQGEPQVEGFAKVVDWAAAAGLVVKGHPLFWSIQKCVPDWVMRYPYETRMVFVEARVRSLVARFRGKVTQWDAINEAMWEPTFRNLPHRHWPHIDPIPEIADYIEPVLRWARDEDPDACYVVNDYGMEQDKRDSHLTTKDGEPVTAASQRVRFLELARTLWERGTPPDALGMQAHTGGWQSHASQVAVYDEMQTSGLPIHITEFWARTRDLVEAGMPADEADAVQADYVADYLTVAFGHPGVEAFYFWGWDGVQWLDDLKSGHALRPVFHRVKRLFKEEWLTRDTLTTDSDGVARFRGFFGDYRLRHALTEGTRTGVAFAVSPGAAMPLTLTAPLVRRPA